MPAQVLVYFVHACACLAFQHLDTQHLQPSTNLVSDVRGHRRHGRTHGIGLGGILTLGMVGCAPRRRIVLPAVGVK